MPAIIAATGALDLIKPHPKKQQRAFVDVSARVLRNIIQDATTEFHRLHGLGATATSKADGSLVTSVDTGIDRFLRQRLGEIAPWAEWLSEESRGESRGDGERAVWIVDPLDGTKEYTAGIPEYSISIALAVGDRIVAGAVTNPSNRVGAASGSDGSWESWPGTASKASSASRKFPVTVSRTELGDGSLNGYLDLFEDAVGIGSVAYKLLRVAIALDRATISVRPKSAWDIAGGIALLQARGLSFRLLDGDCFSFRVDRLLFESGFVAGAAEDVARLVHAIGDRRRALSEAQGN